MEKRSASVVGFSTVQGEKGYDLKLKGEVVATGIFEGWYADDDDYNGYDNLSVKIEDDKVIVTAERTEFGADRPGMSYKGNESVTVGTIDEWNRFTKAEKY